MSFSSPSPQVSVIIPAYNEEKTIAQVIDALIRSLDGFSNEIIIVDDASKDGTATIVQGLSKKFPNIHLIIHRVNCGKTGALKTGICVSKGKVVIIQDADLEYDPEDIPDLVILILNNKAKVVYGSRFMGKGKSGSYYLKNYIANRFITFLSNIFTGLTLTDVETCYNAIDGNILRSMIIDSKRFGFEIEVTAKITKLNCRIVEIPISYNGRSVKEGKKIGMIDGLQAIYFIIKYNLFSSKKSSFQSSTVLMERETQ